MVAIRTTFDGEKIAVPPELRGRGPANVIVVFDDTVGSASPSATGGHSFWDVVGKAPSPMSARQVDAEIDEERASWGDR